MKYSVILAALLALVAQGCSTTPSMKAQIAGANIEIAKQRAVAAAKPILDASIPTPHGVMTIVVYAPQGPNNGQIAMPDDPWARAADRAVGVLGTAAGLYLGGTAAVNLIEAAGVGVSKALQAVPDPVVVQPAQTVVVTQPTPLVVTQPEPIVVMQPEPILVTQPEPLIVTPVIVQTP